MGNKPQAKLRPGQRLVLLGALLILTAALLVGRNLQEQHSAARQSSSLLQQARRQMAIQASLPCPQKGALTEGQTADALSDIWEGYNVAGVLSLPNLGLELPVLADYSDALLKVSVCIFHFESDREPAQMVIAGHNYKAHFGGLSQIPIGAKITYQSINGIESHFRVTEVVKISAFDTAALKEGEWDLTLLTCNLDMSKRILVRCLAQ